MTYLRCLWELAKGIKRLFAHSSPITRTIKTLILISNVSKSVFFLRKIKSLYKSVECVQHKSCFTDFFHKVKYQR